MDWGFDRSSEKRIYRTFVVSLTLGIAVCLTGVFLGTALRSRSLIQDEMLTRARAHFDGIVMTRQWNAGYGGVFVEKREGMESSPYLENPDIVSTEGRIYTRKPPATMTREISLYSEKGGLFSFHMASLKPLNPENRPDDFEKQALESFEHGEKEAFLIDTDKYRYMAPLYTQKECLKCHAEQGYREGDVRGGISVAFSIESVQSKLRTNLFIIVILAVAVISLMILFVLSFVSRLRKSLTEIRQEIERMAVTDMLTGVFNRGHLILRFQEELNRAARKGGTLGCILFDIDHFKLVNDRFGHLAGDRVLMDLARLVKDSARTYDILGRYGGEEFLLVLPDTDLASAVLLAERLREKVMAGVEVRSDLAFEKQVTVSLGVACMQEGDKTIEQVIKRADDALYRAKENGRNRVETG